MPSLIKSTAILAFARVTNFALLLLSPVLLVRFLDPQTFGQYREFVIYAMLASLLAAFSIKSNLLYFIPKDSDKTAAYVANTVWIALGTSLIACTILYLLSDLILANTSFDFLTPLILYVFFFTSLDFLESYWLARKEPRNVLYYSVARTTARIGAVVVTAMFAPTAEALIRTLVAVEICRIVAVAFVMYRLRLRILPIDRYVLRGQLAFIVPLGLAASLHHVNHYVGQLAISSYLGVVALAVYTIGSYQVPVLSIIRGSINDSIFPDMVREAASTDKDNLRLWKRSNVAYSSLIMPIFVLLVWYADDLIPLMFTEQYADAVPIFRILSTVMLVQCFEFSSPLRAVNRNRLLLASNILLLAINIGIIFIAFAFFEPYALYGPAFAIVLAYVLQLTFLGAAITVVYSIPLSNLMKWKSLMIITVSALLASSALLGGEFIKMPDLVRVTIFSCLFMGLYFLCIRRGRLEEFEAVLRALTGRLRRRRSDAPV